MVDIITDGIVYSATIWAALSLFKAASNKVLRWFKKKDSIQSLLGGYMCQKCITFWLVLVITFNPFTASVAALAAALIDIHFNNAKIEL